MTGTAKKPMNFGSGGSPAGVADTQRYHQMALEESLRSGPNISLSWLCLVVFTTALTYGKVDHIFLSVWTVLSILFGLAHWCLTAIFRKQGREESQANRKLWLTVAMHGPTVIGILFVAILWFAFPTLGATERAVLVFVSCGLVMDAQGLGQGGQGLLVLAMFGHAVAWTLGGSELMWRCTPLHLVGLFIYLGSRKQLNALAIDRVALVEHTKRLSDELSQRNLELEKLSQDKSLLLASASHDLRQPVHALGLLIENLAGPDSAENQYRRLSVVQSRVASLGDMLNSLMDASQIERGTYRLRNADFNMHSFLLEVVHSWKRPALQKGLWLRLETGDTRALGVRSDRGLLSRLVSNLIGNAIKYTNSGGIFVELGESESGDSFISVQDTGIGIPPEKHAEVFRAFVRLDEHSHDVPSLGIGLSIVQHCVHLLGMSLEFESTYGSGSKFTLTIPKSMVYMAEGQPSNALAATGWGTEVSVSDAGSCIRAQAQCNLLVVEDDPVILSATVDLLQSWGYNVRGVLDISSALTTIQFHRFLPDLLITDYQLASNETGLDCIRKIRSLTELRDLPVIVLTGTVGLLEQSQALQSNALRLMFKPAQPRLLRSAIEDLLESRDAAA